MGNERDNLQKSVSAYYTYKKDWIMLFIILSLLPFQALNLLGTEKPYHPFLVSALIVVMFVSCLCWLMTNWRYSKWASSGIPYVEFDKDSVSLLGEKILWSSVSYIKVLKATRGRSAYSPYLVVGLTRDMQHRRCTAHQVEKLSKNWAVSTRYKLDKDTFLSLSFIDHLTLSPEQIGATAEMYWNAATGGKVGTINDGLPPKSVLG